MHSVVAFAWMALIMEEVAVHVNENVVDDIAGTTSDPNLVISGDKYLTATGIEATYTNIDVTNSAGADLTVDAGGKLNF